MFSLLLSGSNSYHDPCESENIKVIEILSIVALGVAVIIIFICVVVAEYRVRQNSRSFKQEVSTYNWGIEENNGTFL
jgi:hypothetical protein